MLDGSEERKMNRFEKSLDRIQRNVEIEDGWTDDDLEHYKTIIEALEIASKSEETKAQIAQRPTEKGGSSNA